MKQDRSSLGHVGIPFRNAAIVPSLPERRSHKP
jgi:hypothetical protein